MLQRMHDRSQGWVTWLVVIFISMMFALWGISYYLNSGRGQSVSVGEVNGSPILARHVKQRFDQLRQDKGGSAVALTETQLAGVRKQAIDEIIQEKLLFGAAESMGFIVSRNRIDDMIAKIPAFQSNGHFSQQHFDATLRQLGLSVDELRYRLMSDILINQVRLGLGESEFVTQHELGAFKQAWYADRVARVLKISSSHFKPLQAPTEAEIESYYVAHTAAFSQPEQVRLSYVKLSLDDLVAGIHISDQVALDYYETHQQSFRDSAGKRKPFAQVKTDIIQQLRAQQAQDQYMKLGEQLEEMAFERAGGLKEIAETLHLPVHQTAYFSKAGKHEGLLMNPAVRKAAFSDEVLHQHNNSELINLSDREAIVLRLDGHHPAQVSPLGAVRAEIEKTLLAQAAIQQAKHEAKALVVALTAQHQQAVDTIMHAYDLSWQPAHRYSYAQDDQSASRDPLAKAILRMSPSTVAGQSAYQLVPLSDGVAVIALDKVDYQEPKLSSGEQRIYQRVIANFYDDLLYHAYTRALRAHADIQLNG